MKIFCLDHKSGNRKVIASRYLPSEFKEIKKAAEREKVSISRFINMCVVREITKDKDNE